MDVFLMIRRNKTTIFADAKETTTVLEVKKIIEKIIKEDKKNRAYENRKKVEMKKINKIYNQEINKIIANVTKEDKKNSNKEIRKKTEMKKINNEEIKKYLFGLKQEKVHLIFYSSV
jgi:hypothetical protein